MLTVLCVKFGNKYGSDYVEKLRNMVSRHLTVPYEFACLTDDRHPIKGVRTILQPSKEYSKKWWHKVHMFDPTLPIDGRILYLDLDVIIHSSIDKVVSNLGNDFYGIRDFNRKFVPKWDRMNSSCMSWIAGLHSDIFEKFISNPHQAMKLHGDQDWIFQIARNKIKYWPDAWIQSYKWEIRSRNEIDFSNPQRRFKTVRAVDLPRECSICVFHGDPNPHDINDPYVLDNWC